MFWLTNLNQNLLYLKTRNGFYYNAYIINTSSIPWIDLNFSQIILDNINFVKIKI
jgi:hypothetical protein